MEFRGVYRAGVVVPDEGVQIPEGAVVKFSHLALIGPHKKPDGRKGPRAKLYGLGIWREDPSLGSTGTKIARSLRGRVTRRGAAGQG